MAEAYLLNCWYQAANSCEVRDKPFARTLLDVRVVLFRSHNRIVALRDLCPHRFAPLSKGVVEDGGIVCGYHGLAFDETGKCLRNPHGPIAKSLHVQAYPTVERHSAVWIWMGAPEMADPELIPDLSFIDETPQTARIGFYIPVAANYRLVNDNLLDLSHADFLHPSSLGGVMTGVRAQTTVRQDRVVVEWNNINCTAPPRFHDRAPPPQRADAWTRATWSAPAVVVIETALVPTGTARQATDEILALHSMTPETQTRTHYFVVGTRRNRLDDEQYSERLRAMLGHAFLNEDRPMLEAQQVALGGADFSSLRPALLGIDAGIARVRDELDKRIAREHADGHRHPSLNASGAPSSS